MIKIYRYNKTRKNLHLGAVTEQIYSEQHTCVLVWIAYETARVPKKTFLHIMLLKNFCIGTVMLILSHDLAIGSKFWDQVFAGFFYHMCQ